MATTRALLDTSQNNTLRLKLMGEIPQASYLRTLFETQQRNNPMAPGIKELVNSLDWALSDHDLLDFDVDNPDHWVVALNAKLDQELAIHVPCADLRYVYALMQLVSHAQWMSKQEWHDYRNALVEAHGLAPPVAPAAPAPPVPTGLRRCDPESPEAGCIDVDDPEDAPQHGTMQRYNNTKYRCRCAACKQANSIYRKERRDQQKESP